MRFFGERVAGGDIWALCGSLPPGIDQGLYGRMLEVIHGRGATALLDSRGEALRLGIQAKPSMVKPNLAELSELFGEEIRGIHHIALKGKRILDMGIEYGFISLGEEGMVAVHGSDCLLCGAPRVKAIDTVGCGDALVAGILVARKREYSLPDTCRLAVACGVSKSLHRGAGEIDKSEVQALAGEVTVTAV
jgi:fructose-1-phosphate kinase PfkB-like protein